MTTRRDLLATGAVAPLMFAGPSRAATPYWPAREAWETIAPAAAGFDPGKLDAAVKAVIADRSTSMLVLRGGRIVAEAYGGGWGPDNTREIASAGKSMVSVLVGMAIDDGKIKSLDQSASDFIPEWKGGDRSAVTIRHLVTMTSGLNDQGLAIRNVAGDQAALNATAKLERPPGTRWAYSTAMYHMMFHVVARAVGEKFETFAQRKLLGPLGMRQTSWLTNSGRDAVGASVTNYYTALCTARDLGRFGLFAVNGGQWDGKALVKPAYFKASTSPSQELNPCYGYLWWLNAKPGHAPARAEIKYQFGDAPKDTFAALGAAGQDVICVPSLDLVVVRQGAAPAGAADQSPVLNAVIGALAVRPS